jgi:hypothetical protein
VSDRYPIGDYKDGLPLDLEFDCIGQPATVPALKPTPRESRRAFGLGAADFPLLHLRPVILNYRGELLTTVVPQRLLGLKGGLNEYAPDLLRREVSCGATWRVATTPSLLKKRSPGLLMACRQPHLRFTTPSRMRFCDKLHIRFVHFKICWSVTSAEG